MPGQSTKYPGKTSLVKCGASDGISIQTEVHGTPPKVHSVALYRGRVVRKQETLLLGNSAHELDSLIEREHATLVAKIHEALKEIAGLTPNAPHCLSIPLLFMESVQAYERGDEDTALRILEALAVLAPEDDRVQSSLKRLLSR